MTWLDWGVIALSVYFVVQGLFKGAPVALLGALAIVVAYLVAALALPGVASVVVNVVRNPTEEWTQWGRLIAFVMTFLGVYTVLVLLVSVLPGAKQPATQAQVLGAFGGLLKALAASMAALGILAASPYAGAIAQDLDRSLIAGHVAGMQAKYIQDLRRALPIEFAPIGPDHKF